MTFSSHAMDDDTDMGTSAMFPINLYVLIILLLIFTFSLCENGLDMLVYYMVKTCMSSLFLMNKLWINDSHSSFLDLSNFEIAICFNAICFGQGFGQDKECRMVVPRSVAEAEVASKAHPMIIVLFVLCI